MRDLLADLAAFVFKTDSKFLYDMIMLSCDL